MEKPIAPLTFCEQNIIKDSLVFYEKYTNNYYRFTNKGYEIIQDKNVLNSLSNYNRS